MSTLEAAAGKAQLILGRVKHLPLQNETQVQEPAYVFASKNNNLLNIRQ